MSAIPVVVPRSGELRKIVAGDPRGYAQQWSFGVPSWRHALEGGFRKARYEVIRIDEQTACHYVTSPHSTTFPAMTLPVPVKRG